jgi:hypothetical protein
LFSSFVQDEIALLPDRFYLTVGAKLEHNYLGGQCKTGHAGSLQNRPYEMARDVILFNPLSPDPASLFWFSNSAAHI